MQINKCLITKAKLLHIKLNAIRTYRSLRANYLKYNLCCPLFPELFAVRSLWRLIKFKFIILGKRYHSIVKVVVNTLHGLRSHPSNSLRNENAPHVPGCEILRWDTWDVALYTPNKHNTIGT